MRHPFVHLHVHTQYSILDGQASIDRLIEKAMEDGMPGIAVTDHGAMFGIKEFVGGVKKKKSKINGQIKDLESENLSIEAGTFNLPEGADPKRLIEENEEKIYELKKKAAFKPIIGCEVYVARYGDKTKKDGKPDHGGYHLILLAKNETGYHNLIKIVSRAWIDGFHRRPRTDRADLEKYSEGLICSSACLGGEVAKAIERNDLEGASAAIEWHKSVFGDDYYLELQLHKATAKRANYEVGPMQENANKHIIELAAKHNVKVIATNDVHFVDEEHAEAHDRLICLNTSRDLDDEKRMLYTKQEWLKTTAEMNEVFGYIPEALTNTIEICDKIEIYSVDNPPIMPEFEIPEDFGTEAGYREKYSHEDLFQEFTRDENGNEVLSREAGEKKIKALGGIDKLYRIKLEADYLGKLAMEGARKKYGDPLSDEVVERMNFELYIMKTMGFPGYFLIVQDFIAAARDELGVSVGPGRGSAAGSAVAYCLGITLIDPIKYDLLFERFLNPDRISLPDIDIDFDDDGRGRVLDWVTNKYGKEKVAHIVTFGTMATKSSIKDVARVQKLPLPESNALCKAIPDKLPDGSKMNLPNAINCIPELKAAEESNDPVMRDTIRYAKMLEGNVRNTGVHACGIIICRDDITDWVPVSTADDKETGEKMLVTQYEGSIIEDTGLIKMDFLGLKTLSIIKEAMANIKLTRGIEFDIEEIDIEDKKTYELYSEGRTVGTFQFESAGMQKYLRDLQPTVFEDLIAMNALYRPGPMDYIPDFVDRKHGRKPIIYDIPIMEQYLKDTYGITVYQEQVMLLSRLLGNFTRGESDTLRKAMGKKLKDKLDELKPKFIEGGKSNGHDPDVLDKIWADWEKFASYAFNKSHATCYSWIAYQTAYLKANYPSEYMAAVLSRNITDIKTLSLYMSECNRMGIKVLSPDVNESYNTFVPNKDGDIRFGLCGIKGVGDAAVTSIVNERKENGPFKDISDFMERVNYAAVNKSCLESLVWSGGFDSLVDFSRSLFFAPDANSGATYLEMLTKYGQRIQADKHNTQQSLFGGDSGECDIPVPSLPAGAKPWGDIETLKKEREAIGLYLSSHPLDEFAFVMKNLCTNNVSDLERLDDLCDMDVAFAGMVTSVQHLISKSNRPWAKFTLEDYNGSYEFALFNKDYEVFRQYLYQDYNLFVKAKVQRRPYGDRDVTINIQSMTQLSEVFDNMVNSVTLQLLSTHINEEFIAALNDVVKASEGKASLSIMVYDANDTKINLQFKSTKYKVAMTPAMVRFLEDREIKFMLT